MGSNFYFPGHGYHQNPNESNMNNNMLLQQKLIFLETYEAQSTCDALVNVFEWLEKYIERTGHYPDWNSRKQVDFERQIEIQRPDRNIMTAEEAKKTFATVLYAFRNVKQNQPKPDWFLEELESQFYKWVDGSKISVHNCNVELAECLVDIHRVLMTEGKEFANKRETQASEGIAKMSKEERKKNVTELFAFRDYYDKQEEKRELLHGQTVLGNDIIKNKFMFNGDPEKGKITFEQIKRLLESQQQHQQHPQHQYPQYSQYQYPIDFK